MKFLVFSCFALVALTMSLGCSPGARLVGTWELALEGDSDSGNEDALEQSLQTAEFEFTPEEVRVTILGQTQTGNWLIRRNDVLVQVESLPGFESDDLLFRAEGDRLVLLTPPEDLPEGARYVLVRTS